MIHNYDIHQLCFNHDYPDLGLRQQSAKSIGGELKLLVGNINKSFEGRLQPGKRVFLHFVRTNCNLNPGKWENIEASCVERAWKKFLSPGVNIQPKPVRLRVLVVQESLPKKVNTFNGKQ